MQGQLAQRPCNLPAQTAEMIGVILIDDISYLMFLNYYLYLKCSPVSYVAFCANCRATGL